ncbi:ABC transporter ATP-binding protein [Georgenia sp. MJ206]|uniref:ABC transporter ATP-binding protein n=1 Tax=Georgenia wangjunii TaxID=3117730 RepID=UPI002F26B081
MSARSTADGGLEVVDVEVRYTDAGPATTAVAGVSLAVPAGEVLALLGPSGCGKSSLLRAVAGLEPVAAGRVLFAGQDVGAVPVHRRGFGLMFQDGQLFPHRDVAGNVGYGLVMAGAGRSERDQRVGELLDLVGLTGYASRAVSTLSGGEKQRVALARALAPRPRLLLLDEPLSSLDRSLREHLSGELRDILRAAGTTALYVTHDHDEAFTVAGRVAVMDAGRILQVDRPARLWRQPRSERVARFLGYGPFLTADVAGGAARTVLGDVPLPAGGVRSGGGDVPGGAAVRDDARGRDDAAARDGSVVRDGGGGPAARSGTVLVGLGPAALRVVDDGGTPVDVVAARFRRGSTELTVVLPSGERATALAGATVAGPTGEGPGQVRVRLDPAGAVVVPR